MEPTHYVQRQHIKNFSWYIRLFDGYTDDDMVMILTLKGIVQFSL